MNQHYYTQEDMDALTALKNEAQSLDAEWRRLSPIVGKAIELQLGSEMYIGWELYHPELSDLIELTHFQYTFAPIHLMPLKVGQFAMGRNIQKPADWAKLNRKCHKEITKTLEVLKKYGMDV